MIRNNFIRSQMSKLTQIWDLENNEKGLAVLRTVTNSFKRNIALPSVGMHKSQAEQEYQSMLTLHNFRPNDLDLLFTHLYSKEQMDRSDRNLLRRLFLSIFPQDVICAAGRQMVHLSKYQAFHKRTILKGSKKFYLILNGSIKITSEFYTRVVSAKQYCGHLEIICDLPSQQYQLTFQPQTLCITIQQQHFNTILAPYFQSFYSAKKSSLPSIITRNLHPLQIYLLCNEMKKQVFPTATRIRKKGDYVSEVVFFIEGVIDQIEDDINTFKNKFNCQKSLGFAEFILQKQYYDDHVFVSHQLTGFTIKVDKMKKFISPQLKQEMKNSAKVFQLQLLSNITLQKKSEPQQLKKFMRVRKVKLPYMRSHARHKSEIGETSTIATDIRSRIREENPEQYQANFVFFQNDQHKISSFSRKQKLKRLNRSQIGIISQKYKTTRTQREMSGFDFSKYSRTLTEN